MILGLFCFLSFLTIVSALSVILSRNPVYSVLSLILCFFSIAGHYILLSAPFLAVVHIIVYAGAIMVLFLFVIMLMMRTSDVGLTSWVKRIGSFFVVGAFGVTIIALMQRGTLVLPRYLASVEGSVSSLGRVLFGAYALPFELSTILFLSAVVGVVMLGKKS